MTGITGRASGALTSALVVAVVLAFAAFAWFGYRAVDGWRHSATLLASQRAGQAADRLVTALGRDMRGVQATVLASAQWDQFMLDPPYDVRTLATSAFARYPYPESFFAWRGPATPPTVVFLNRSDRRPAWMPGAAGPNRFPVIVEYDPAVAGLLMRRIRRDAVGRRRFSVFEVLLGGTRYQVVARLLYRDALREIWRYPDEPATRSVDHAIARLRKKIEADPGHPRFIHTVHGDGYTITPEGRSAVSVQSPG